MVKTQQRKRLENVLPKYASPAVSELESARSTGGKRSIEDRLAMLK
jgi:hypothetical protein